MLSAPRCFLGRSSLTKISFLRRTGISGLKAGCSYCTATTPNLAPAEVKIMYGTQTGTSQLFAMELADQLMASSSGSVDVASLDESPPTEMIEMKDDDALIFLLSCTGKGEPSDNARDFISWIDSDSTELGNLVKDRNYAVFGLGNARTHSENYNVVGKKFDARMEELGAKRIHPLGLGDDSECIEEDFDTWSQSLVDTLDHLDGESKAVPAAADVESRDAAEEGVCLSELPSAQKKSSFPDLILSEYPEDRPVLKNLFDINEQEHGSSGFYWAGTKKMQVTYNKQIAPNRESLRELHLSIKDHPEMTYEVGDHIWIYPENHPSLVNAYARAVDANPFAIIKGVEDPKEDGASGKKSRTRPYPFPLNLSVSETLQHCVDLSATPSPSLTRFILGREVDYKSYVAQTRRTTLDLLLEEGSRKLSLSELLYQLPQMAPRYYSIASSPKSHPHDIYVTFRLVKYLSSRGVLREGVCTSYLNSMRPAFDDDEDGGHARVFIPTLAAGIRSNPGFRLPEDPSVPLILVAGGCGIAPIRSFLDERLAIARQHGSNPFGEAHLFFGVRTDDDEVYHAMIDHALSEQVLTSAHISHSSSCTNPRFVANDIEDSSSTIYDCLEKGAHVYLCGGAVGFAPTCAAAIVRSVAKHGQMSTEDAEEYYMELVRGGRYAEDISE